MKPGRWKSKINKVRHRWMGWKMPLCKWYTFWITPWLILLFCWHILLYWEQVTSYEKFSNNRTLEVPILRKISAFQCYWWKVSKCWKILKFPKISNWKFWNILQDPNSKLPLGNYSLPHQIKASYISGTKIFLYGDIYWDCFRAF